MKKIVQRLLKRPLHAWKTGGVLLRCMAVYSVLSPTVVIPLATGKLIVAVHVSWLAIAILMTIGTSNFVLMLWLLFRRDSVLVGNP